MKRKRIVLKKNLAAIIIIFVVLAVVAIMILTGKQKSVQGTELADYFRKEKIGQIEMKKWMSDEAEEDVLGTVILEGEQKEQFLALLENTSFKRFTTRQDKTYQFSTESNIRYDITAVASEQTQFTLEDGSIADFSNTPLVSIRSYGNDVIFFEYRQPEQEIYWGCYIENEKWQEILEEIFAESENITE